MYRLGKSSPTIPTSFTGAKKLAATAAWLADPPNRRGFSRYGVLIESMAVEPTTRTLIILCAYRVDSVAPIAGAETAPRLDAPTRCGVILSQPDRHIILNR